MRKLLSVLILGIFLISLVSAMDWDNKIEYKNNGLTAEIFNSNLLIFKGEKLGEATLTSHKTPTEIRGVFPGEDRAVMYYYSDNWDKLGLGEVYFTNMKTGKKIEKEYYFAIQRTRNDTYYIRNEKNEIIEIRQREVFDKWERIEENPTGKATIALITDVKDNDYIDGVWTIAGKKIENHASWADTFEKICTTLYEWENKTARLGSYDLETNSGDPTFSQDDGCLLGYCANFTNSQDINMPHEIITTIQDNSTADSHAVGWWVRPGGYTGNFFEFATTAESSYSEIRADYNYLIDHIRSVAGFDLIGGRVSKEGDWTFIYMNFNESGAFLYINATLKDTLPEWNEWATTDITFTTAFYGQLDDWYVFNRSLTAGELQDLYNGGAGLEYSPIPPDNSPTITLNSPIDYYNTTSNNLDLNCSGTDDNFLDNITLNVDGTTNYTISDGTDNFIELFINYNFTEGSHNWTCSGVDNSSQIGTTDTRYFSIDMTSPSVNITYPTENLTILTNTTTFNVTLNFTASDPNLETCWIYNGTANNTLTCGLNSSIVLPGGYHTIFYYANDSVGNENSTSVTFFLNSFVQNISYESSLLEKTNQTIYLNLTATHIGEINGTLVYNGTSYNSTASYNSTTGNLSVAFITPVVNETTVFDFYFDYWINGYNYVSTTYTQTVNIINLTVATTCPAGLSPSMCWDFKVEENLTVLTNVSIAYNFGFGSSNSTYKENYGSLDEATSFCLCINSTISNDYSLGSGEIHYSKVGFANRRFYTFSTQRLSNETINNTLHLLPSGDATSFLFSFKDTSLTAYSDKYASLLRWYPDLDQYSVVEMAKTDDKGETIMRVKVEDADYRVGLYHQNGTLIKLLNPVRFACLSSPCSYDTLIEGNPSDYTSFFGVENSLTYNETSNIWTFVWNDPTQKTDTMRLLVTRERGDSSFTICDDTASGFTGVLACDSSGYTGTLVGLAFRTASPETPIAQKLINTGTTVFAGTVGLFISFLIFLTLALIGIFSPIISIVLGVAGLFPAYIFGSISLAVFIAIGVLGGIVIHFMKRTG